MSEYVVAVIVAIITSGGLLLGQRVTAKGQRASGMTPSYEALDKRNASLEDRLDKQDRRIDLLDRNLRDALEDRDNFAEALDDVKQVLREFVAWFNSGAKPPPPPIPLHLRDQIGDYEVARVTEISLTTTGRITYPEEPQP